MSGPNDRNDLHTHILPIEARLMACPPYSQTFENKSSPPKPLAPLLGGAVAVDGGGGGGRRSLGAGSGTALLQPPKSSSALTCGTVLPGCRCCVAIPNDASPSLLQPESFVVTDGRLIGLNVSFDLVVGLFAVFHSSLCAHGSGWDQPGFRGALGRAVVAEAEAGAVCRGAERLKTEAGACSAGS
jgi:hypothetical protein